MPGDPVLLFPEEAIADRVRELAGKITADYAGREPMLVAILRGSVMFLADLVRQIDLPLIVDFMSISKYGDADGDAGQAASSGSSRTSSRTSGDGTSSSSRTSSTRASRSRTCSRCSGPVSPPRCEVCTLLDKQRPAHPHLEIQVPGFECPDQFVVGYGLDLDERYRNLPYIVGMPGRAVAEEWPALDVPGPGAHLVAGPVPA